MTIKALYPNVRPSLELDFANTKALDPRITFTRASTATFVGADGLIQTAASGAARFDHNPTTGESLGLLVEEARTNLLTYSSTLSSPWYFPYLTRAANAGVAPDGTSTASSFTTTAVGGYKLLQPAAPTTSTSTDYCFSVYVKLLSGTGTASRICIGSNNGLVTPNYASYGLRLDNVTETTTGNVPSIKGYTALPNGWFRIYMVYNMAAQTSPSVTIYVGDLTTDVASFLIWGAQFEQGSFPTSYIPTTTATVTRVADVASMTGTNFSSWYNQSQGSLLGSFVSLSNGSASPIAALYQTSSYSANRISLRIANSFCYTGSALQFSFPTSYTANQSTKVAWGFGSTATYYKNGTLVGTDSSVTLPTTLNEMSIGTLEGSEGFPINGTIARLAYYPVRLSDTQLQALTAT